MQKRLFALVRLWVLLAAPMFFVSYGYAFVLLHDVVALWVWFLAIAAHVTVWLAIGSLLDTLRGKKE